jgi:DNA ligase 1
MKPMLAAATDGTNLSYPVLVSPKLDGVRCLIIDGVAMSRSLKPIPNQFVQTLFGKSALNGLDGELIVGPPTGKDVYQRTVSGVMAKEGNPAVTFHVFDTYLGDQVFYNRLKLAETMIKKAGCVKLVKHIKIMNEEALMTHEAVTLIDGYEGVMIRHPTGPYKHGRSTLREGWLLKLKRFEDSEAVILDAMPLMHNDNEAKRNELGQLERSSHKANKEARELVGSFLVRDLKTNVEFEIGTGFTEAQRRSFWKDVPIGKIVKYKYQPTGVKDKPRFPVFLGFRDERDL